ncbi:hypothetical protein CHGG_02127 [Chaetomium globosum CBS 148.51]|uniref:Uncharacterized protein n=1 Tax=Chaetomium globosum (strain ATCC 6205 / CBS 148.51 / DSM 1962 / NBRC 6347 / NRRL 1970) TaxID=306901 RepID=Q2HCC7_CHAGB|nr:uncharacterized protein CHGG_02127 [Chaetomium globosum CBS 148.51]EAQ93892.1 hypothetical protein CHGG_02127 [Chaetomium globosum CBS 148.51]
MAVLSSLPRALLLAFLVTAGVHGNPVDLGSGNAITCASVRCIAGTACLEIDGRPQCVPIKDAKCGNTVCEAGTVCCNSSCSLCVKPGHGVHCPYLPARRHHAFARKHSVARATCKAGQECCNESCGICVEPGKGCTKQLCVPGGEQCGKTVCPAGLQCCNSSCGVCTKPGEACTMQLCGEEPGKQCGKTVCPAGLTCCNSSCGICVPPGGACTQQVCLN